MSLIRDARRICFFTTPAGVVVTLYARSQHSGPGTILAGTAAILGLLVLLATWGKS